VQVLRSNNISQRVIAANIGCDVQTLRKHFKGELADGHAQVVAAMGAALVRAGLAGNVGALRYWLSTHGGPQRTFSAPGSGCATCCAEAGRYVALRSQRSC
jgi:hypothetical protein